MILITRMWLALLLSITPIVLGVKDEAPKQAFVIRSNNAPNVDGGCSGAEWRFQDFQGLSLVFSTPLPEDVLIATGVVDDKRTQTGWSELTIRTLPMASQREARFAAGILEGF